MARRLVVCLGSVYPFLWALRHMKVSQSWATGFEDWVLLLIGACFTIDYVIQRLFRIGETPMGPFRRPIQTEPDGDEEEPPGVPESRWEY